MKAPVGMTALYLAGVAANIGFAVMPENAAATFNWLCAGFLIGLSAAIWIDWAVARSFSARR